MFLRQIKVFWVTFVYGMREDIREHFKRHCSLLAMLGALELLFTLLLRSALAGLTFATKCKLDIGSLGVLRNFHLFPFTWPAMPCVAALCQCFFLVLSPWDWWAFWEESLSFSSTPEQGSVTLSLLGYWEPLRKPWFKVLRLLEVAQGSFYMLFKKRGLETFDRWVHRARRLPPWEGGTLGKVAKPLRINLLLLWVCLNS